MPKINGCPFCGATGAGDVWSGGDAISMFAVFCDSCDATGPRCATRERAILAWNKATNKPRPMSEAPRDGTWVLVAVQVRPDKHRWRTAHWDSKLSSWIEGGSQVLRGLREPVAWMPHTLVPTSSGGEESNG